MICPLLLYKIDCYNAAVHVWQLLWDVLVDAVEEETLYTLKPDKKKKGDEDEEVGLTCTRACTLPSNLVCRLYIDLHVS